MTLKKIAILTVDEGTSGTRAALVFPDAEVSEPIYKTLNVVSPRHSVIEQDANEILDRTLEVCRAQIAAAKQANITITAMAITTQRATAVLWDKRTGRPIVPAIVWQDSRYAKELEALEHEWNNLLFQTAGRPIAGRSHYLWAVKQIAENTDVRAAYQKKNLAFGSIDTWLLWNLSEGKPLYTTPTNAASMGAYDLSNNDFCREWLEALNFPLELLPELKQDADDFGMTREDVLSIRVPIRACSGDQQAGIIGLGCHAVGDAMCIHGTGSFVELITGEKKPRNLGAYDACFAMTGWRRKNISHYIVETYSSATGAALNWICKELKWFKNAEEISAYAARTTSAKGMIFQPSVAGLRLPMINAKARGALNGISMSHTRNELAYAILEGIAHSVNACMRADEEVAGLKVNQIRTGGGLSRSTPLLQMQADLTGIPIRRVPGASRSSLRGTAFLAASEGQFWNDLQDAQSHLAEGDYFEPKISCDERENRVMQWNSCIHNELKHAEQPYYL